MSTEDDYSTLDVGGLQPSSPLSPEVGMVEQDLREEALWWFLRVLNGAAGIADAGDWKWNPLNVFCADYEPTDTFNWALERGFTLSTHDSDSDGSTVFLTDAGRAHIGAYRKHMASRDLKPAASGGLEGETDRFWLIVHEPGCVPERKGPWPRRLLKETLREFMAARPAAYIDLLTMGYDGPQVEHGPLALQVLDGRSMSVGRRHNQQTRAAHAVHHANLASTPPQVEREGSRDDLEALDLDAMEKVLSEVTPGVWKAWGMSLLADQDGTGNVETAVEVATFHTLRDGRPRTHDLAAVQLLMRAAPRLIATNREMARERDEARRVASLGCDANSGGAHQPERQGNYTFCRACGETLKAISLTERTRLAEARAEAAEASNRELLGVVKEYQGLHERVAADILSAHRNRGNGTTQWMTEDDQDLRRDFRAAGERARTAISNTLSKSEGSRDEEQ